MYGDMKEGGGYCEYEGCLCGDAVDEEVGYGDAEKVDGICALPKSYGFEGLAGGIWDVGYREDEDWVGGAGRPDVGL